MRTAASLTRPFARRSPAGPAIGSAGPGAAGARYELHAWPDHPAASGHALRHQAAPVRTAGPPAVTAGVLVLAGLVGCSAGPAALARRSSTATQPAVGRTLAPISTSYLRQADPDAACVLCAAAAATVAAPAGTLGQYRQDAAHRYDTQRRPARYAGAGQGRDRQQELWQQHHAHVMACAPPVVTELHHEHDQGDSTVADHRALTSPGAEHAPVSVTGIVTGTAHADSGWSAPVPPNRLARLLLADPTRGCLVDDLHTEPPSTPAATPAPTSSR
jgi:hypothetical protein